MKNSDNILAQKLEKLFREHFCSLCYFSESITGDLEQAKSIVHKTFRDIWGNRKDFEWEIHLKNYLFNAVGDYSLVYSKKTLSKIDLENLIKEAEIKSRIVLSMNKLPLKNRQITDLHFYKQNKYSEISSLLNIPVKTVESSIMKTIRLLKEDLKDFLYLLIFLLLSNAVF